MKTAAPSIACTITSTTAETLRAAMALAKCRANPESVTVDEVFAYSSGMETSTQRQHRMGDYFESIEVLEDSVPNSFTLVFHVREGADRYWRDLIAKMLVDLRKVGTSVSDFTFGG